MTDELTDWGAAWGLDGGAARLALLLALAGRAEPELIRAVRLSCVPESDVGAEQRVWFSPLVDARSEAGVTFASEVVLDLRRRLARLYGGTDRPVIDRAHAVIGHVHANISPLLQVEEELAWAEVTGDAAETERISKRLVQAVAARRPGIDRWLSRTWRRAPASARRTRSGWVLAHVAGAHTEPVSDLHSLGTTELSVLLAGVSDVPLHIGRGPGVLRLGVSQDEANAAFPVPDTVPRLLEITSASTAVKPERVAVSRQVELMPDSTVDVDLDDLPVRVRTARGDIYELDASVGDHELPAGRPADDGSSSPEVELPRGIRAVGTLRSPLGGVAGLAWSPDGALLALPSLGNAVGIFDATTLQRIATLTVPSGGARAAAFDQQGRLLVAGHEDGSITFWEVGSWRQLREVAGEIGSVLAAIPVNDLVVVAGTAGSAVVRSDKSEVVRLLDTLRATAIAVDPAGQTVAIARANDVHLYELGSGRPLSTAKGHFQRVRAICFSPNGRVLASASLDRTVRIWRHDGSPLASLEGFTGPVQSVSFTADGQLLASREDSGLVRLWDANAWSSVAAVPLPAGAASGTALAAHPFLPRLATVGAGAADDVVHIWDLDIEELLGRERPSAVRYVSVKIVLLGNPGVGKTGLGWRLAYEEFREHSSTHGQQFWVLDALGMTRSDGAECEAVLWDLAGQPDYRITHSLFVEDADLALILFDPTSYEDPLAGVDYWLTQLTGAGVKVILVAARMDRGASRLPEEEIARFCRERGISSYVQTSALHGEGLDELVRAMRDVIRWEAKPATVTTETFRWIRDVVLALKEDRDPTGGSILSPAELRRRLQHQDQTRTFTDDELTAAIGHLVNHGFVAWLATSKGEPKVLLAPELLNNLASSIVLEARRNPRGLGALDEQWLLSGSHQFPELDRLHPDQRVALLDSAVVLFLRRNICFRQVDQLNARVLLVFPELINQRRPLDIAGVRLDEGAAYTVSGAVDNVYASLVVLLGYSPMLVRTYQWRDQVEYVTDEGFRCGFRLESESKAELHFFLYYGADVPDSIRQMFQGLFETLLAGRDLTVHRLEPVVCRNGHTQDRAIIRQEIAQGRTVMSCPYCAVQVPLLGVEASIDLTGGTATDGDIQHVAADRRARFERALFQLKAFAVRADERQPTCFVSYAWGDPEHERWVERQLSTDLVKAGIAVMLDRWENERTDTSVPQFLERVAAADRIVVVGSRLYREKYESGEPMRSTAVAAAEADLINQRLLDQETRRRSVLPLVVDGPPEQALPPLLQDRIYVDLRDPQHYFTGFFDLALAVHGLSPADPVVAQLREELIAAVTN